MNKKDRMLSDYLYSLKETSDMLLTTYNKRDRRLEWLIDNVEKRLEVVRNEKTRNNNR